VAQPRNRKADAALASNQPSLARAREGCRAGAQRAKAGYSARELRLGKQNIENNPMQRKEHLEKKGVAGMDAIPAKTF